MRYRMILIALALSLGWLYVKVLIVAIGVATALASPPWWNQLFTSRLSAITTWIMLCHTAAVLLVALPFAYAIARLYRRIGILLALGLTIALYAIDPLPAVLAYFQASNIHTKLITLFDAVKLLGILPGLVWVFTRPTSDNRMEPSRYDAAKPTPRTGN
jgi:hypothetical protein